MELAELIFDLSRELDIRIKQDGKTLFKGRNNPNYVKNRYYGYNVKKVVIYLESEKVE